jgi:hypothetical protein
MPLRLLLPLLMRGVLCDVLLAAQAAARWEMGWQDGRVVQQQEHHQLHDSDCQLCAAEASPDSIAPCILHTPPLR